MYFIAVLVLLGIGQTVNCGVHSLTYTYTAFSKPVTLPGFHDFTAMGQLDDRMIDYFDSNIQKKVPKQKWMNEKLPEDYWEKGTQSRQSKQQWFKVNIDILKSRMRQNDSDIHVLQWIHGCEANELPDGSMKFRRGMDMYSYDGDNFLSFDDKSGTWVASIPAANPTKKKWDDVQVLKEYTKGYLENECMDWLNKFMKYEKETLTKALHPKVFVFSKKAHKEKNVILACLATGYYPKEIVLQIKRDGRVLTLTDGLFSSGTRPNGDGSFQRRDHVEILKSDMSTYTCEVKHIATGVRVVETWDHTLPDDSTGLIIAGVLLLQLLLLISIVVLVLYKKGIIRNAVLDGQNKTGPWTWRNWECGKNGDKKSDASGLSLKSSSTEGSDESLEVKCVAKTFIKDDDNNHTSPKAPESNCLLENKEEQRG